MILSQINRKKELKKLVNEFFQGEKEENNILFIVADNLKRGSKHDKARLYLVKNILDNARNQYEL